MVDPHTPFILVTGALGDERAVELLRGGASDFILKDRLGRLASAIERTILDREARKLQDRMQARLAQAQQLSKLAAQAARMGTWQIDVETGALDCSDEFLHLLGIERASWAGTLAALEARMPDEDIERLRNAHIEARKNGTFVNLEFRVFGPSGEVKWVQWRGDYINGPDGTPQYCLGVMVDVTERLQMEEALRASDRRKDEFLATLAHELRNPLAPVASGFALLRQLGEYPPQAASVHAMVERQLDHIVRLVDDLLDISRITLGKIELRKAPVGLAEVVHSAVEMNRAAIEGAGQKLHVSLGANVTLDADAVRLTQVLSNLLSNASKYTVEAGDIWLATRSQDEHVLISVRDNGMGIPAATLPHVFDLFAQGDTAGLRGKAGLGIGLAMVRLLVEMHGGSVEARSAGVGQGAEFTVRLPVVEIRQASPTMPEAPTSTGSPEEVSLAGLRVLVVDDNRDAADTLSMLLTLVGADARAAYDGEDALDTLASHEADVILLDLGMPGMDGYAVANRIRSDARYRNMTLVAVTGRGQEKDRARSKAEGFDHHLSKPTDFNHLVGLLGQVKPRVASIVR
jgi:PAS domain S-box-containing protein